MLGGSGGKLQGKLDLRPGGENLNVWKCAKRKIKKTKEIPKKKKKTKKEVIMDLNVDNAQFFLIAEMCKTAAQYYY